MSLFGEKWIPYPLDSCLLLWNVAREVRARPGRRALPVVGNVAGTAHGARRNTPLVKLWRDIY